MARPGACGRVLRLALLLLAGALVAACGGGSSTGSPQPSNVSAYVSGVRPGATPFIAILQLQGSRVAAISSVRFTIAPAAGAASRAVDITLTGAYLARLGYTAGPGGLAVPVFGLYAGTTNHLALQLVFQDGTTQALAADVVTAAYTDPNGIYDHPVVHVPRTPGGALGFDYFAMKSAFGTPIVVDTDGHIRWVAAGIVNAQSSAFQGGAFVIGDPVSTGFWRLELDGSIHPGKLSAANYTTFHHNIDPGKLNLLGEVNGTSGGVVAIETLLSEFDPSGLVLHDWDLGAILSAYMTSQGDDPTAFVRPGVDWFHLNAAAYDPRDDSLIVSSRENFVIKIDYSTGAIRWILGDPTKYWYTFPSLRAKALALPTTDLAPVGQHAVSITHDGLLLLFNDGTASTNQPAGAPAGVSRTYSAVSAYSINPVAGTAQEAWRFDYGQSIDSAYCSSAYETSEGSLLVDYAMASNGAAARLVGLDPLHNVVFDFEYASPHGCVTSWNAVPVAFESLVIG